MKLVIVIRQHDKKPRRIEVEMRGPVSPEQMRRVWEAEHALNTLPTDLRVHLSFEPSKEGE